MYIKKLHVQGQGNVPFIGRHVFPANSGSSLQMMGQNFQNA